MMRPIAGPPGSRPFTTVLRGGGAALAGTLAVLAALALFATSPRAAGPACTENREQGRLCVSLTDTPDPVSYSSFDGNLTYLSYEASVANDSRSSNLSHVGYTQTLPAGSTFVSASPSAGSCSATGLTLTCEIGAMDAGDAVTIEIVVTAPETSAPDPPDQTISSAATASFDERFSDQTGGKQDTVGVTEDTLVSATAGQTFVPTGLSGRVDTDPGATQYANATLPTVSTDVLATIQVLDPDAFCVDGTVRIGRKTYVCRDGGFVEVTVLDADTGSTYANNAHPLVFHLRWGSDLVSGRQTVRNFVVFYRTGDSSPLQVINSRCNANATNLPCLRNIQEAADGSFSADLVKSSNGHMR